MNPLRKLKESLNERGYHLFYYGYVGRPYTFWRRLLSLKWVRHPKLYFPIMIINYKRHEPAQDTKTSSGGPA